jgi:hypothetical protein
MTGGRTPYLSGILAPFQALDPDAELLSLLLVAGRPEFVGPVFGQFASHNVKAGAQRLHLKPFHPKIVALNEIRTIALR